MIKYKLQVRTSFGVFESVAIESSLNTLHEVVMAYSDNLETLDNIYFEVSGGEFALIPNGILQNSFVLVIPA